MKLLDFDTRKGSDEGAVLKLRNPVTGEATDAWIKLAGPDGKVAKTRRAEIRRRLRGMSMKNPDLNQLEEEAALTRVAMTLDWGGIELEKPLDCTPENVRTLYDRIPWVAEAVDDFLADRANFLADGSIKPKG